MKIEINAAWIGSIFSFNAMLTPKIITFVYWLALVGCIIGGILTMMQRGSAMLPAGIAIMVGGPILARIWCELFIVLFKIEEHLREQTKDAED